MGTIFASDPQSNHFVFKFFPPVAGLPLAIDPETGDITVSGVINYYVTPTINVSVVINQTEGWGCQQSARSFFLVTVVNSPRPPYFSAQPSVVTAVEQSVYPRLLNLSSSYNVTAMDMLAGNSSLVSVSATATTVYEYSSGALYGRTASTGYFDIVSASSGNPCVGGSPCFLRVSAGCPDLNYDDGLRYVVVTLIAVGATGLSTTTSVNVTVVPINEGKVSGI